jgi:NADH-quinone oxidoreductase subunit L
MGAFSTVLENKYGFDDFGYRFIVVPVRDTLARGRRGAATRCSTGSSPGRAGPPSRSPCATYRVLDQRVIDGGVNGAAFSAAWWSERLKRIQSGDVQRYAAALVAGVIVLVLAFAAAS